MRGRWRPERVHHPVFARIFARVSARAEDRGQSDHRRELLSGLSGRVIEVGAGNGLNFAKYPDGVNEVVALEPEEYLRSLAQDAAAAAAVPIRVIDGLADALPAEAASFDAGVCSLVLCSVREQAAALAELYRVIRPGGELRFYEHVIATGERLALAQRIADQSHMWPLVAGGSHVSRDTAAAIERAGFEIASCRRFRFSPGLVEFLAAPKILGRARRPADS